MNEKPKKETAQLIEVKSYEESLGAVFTGEIKKNT